MPHAAHSFVRSLAGSREPRNSAVFFFFSSSQTMLLPEKSIAQAESSGLAVNQPRKYPKSPARDKTMECFVCGKHFPRGHLDLHRHINAITLQHLASKHQSDRFKVPCTKCGLFFTCKEHLEIHRSFSFCARSTVPTQFANSQPKPQVQVEPDAAPSSTPSRAVSDSLPPSTPAPPPAPVPPLLLSPAAIHPESTKTMECMICGKLFPRGPIDLQRHATAITLKHATSPSPAPGFSFSCSKCEIYFTTAEHLQMHLVMSTCNPDMVWPPNAGSTSGLRAITRAQAADIIAAAANATSSLPPSSTAFTSATGIAAITSPSRLFVGAGDGLFPARDPSSQSMGFSHSMAASPTSPSYFSLSTGQRRTVARLERAMLKPIRSPSSDVRADSAPPTAAHGHSLRKRERDKGEGAGRGASAPSIAIPSPSPRSMSLLTAGTPTPSSAGLSHSNRWTLSGEPGSRTKRTKVILPDERKAFFAAISLLIDPSQTRSINRLTEENFEQFVAQEHLPLVHQLKNTLLYTC